MLIFSCALFDKKSRLYVGTRSSSVAAGDRCLGTAGDTDRGESLPQEQHSQRDSEASSLQKQGKSVCDDTNMHPGRDSLQQPAQGLGSVCGDTQQPESDLHEWDSYVEYINRKVIHEPAEITADSTGLQGRKPILSSRHVRSNSTHTERFAQNRDKKIQAELSAQLSQAEAAVGVFSFLSDPSDARHSICCLFSIAWSYVSVFPLHYF
jgi:hypothetical protein